MTLWLARHAKLLVGADICYGAMDVPADEQAAAELVRQLAAVLPLDMPVLCSPAQRCAHVGHALEQLRPDLSLSVDRDLLEFDFGSWQGRRWDDIGRHEYEDWIAHFGDHRVGGGECVNALLRRTGRALQRTSELAHAGQAAWITHAGVIQAAALLARGIGSVNDASQWPQAAVASGSWVVQQHDFNTR